MCMYFTASFLRLPGNNPKHVVYNWRKRILVLAIANTSSIARIVFLSICDTAQASSHIPSMEVLVVQVSSETPQSLISTQIA